MTAIQENFSPETVLAGAEELREKLKEQSQLRESFSQIEYEYNALETRKTNWLKEQIKLAREEDDTFNDLSTELSGLKKNPDYTEAELAFKTTKENLGIPELEREKKERGRELALQVEQSPEALQIAALLEEKAKELINTRAGLDEANDYIRTRGITMMDAVNTQLRLL